MKTTAKIGITMVLVALFLYLPSGVVASEPDRTGPDPGFSQAQLAQMLAPIALYPDAVLAQILMASTYPIEVIEAARWSKQNLTLKGTALDDALKNKEWDVSVKSLTHFPKILDRMSTEIGETSMLGNAFLGQQTDVMDTIQALRAKARTAGNLETTKEQTVIADEAVIRIEPANPRVIYVPAYYPSLVYGTWWYPAYPPFAAWYPIGYPPTGYVSFSTGLWVGAAIGWCDFSWHRRTINVYHRHTKRYYRKEYFQRRNYRPGPYAWRHDSVHRRGVFYRERGTSRRFGGSAGMSARDRGLIRGAGQKRPVRITTTPQKSPFEQPRLDLLQKIKGFKKHGSYDRKEFKRKGSFNGATNKPAPQNPRMSGQTNSTGKWLDANIRKRFLSNGVTPFYRDNFNHNSSTPEVRNRPIPPNRQVSAPNIVNRKLRDTLLKKQAQSQRPDYRFGTRPRQGNNFSRGDSVHSRSGWGNDRASGNRIWP